MDWGIWNTIFADLVCQKLGFSSSLALESIPKPEDSTEKSFYKLNPNTFNSNIEFKKTDGNCDQFASIVCQEYGKYFKFTKL